MSRVLTARESRALEKLSFDHENFHISGELPGIGMTTLNSLVALGLVEEGPSKRYRGQMGWRVTSDAWRCMYGKTYEEIMAGEKPVHPLRQWRWPPLAAPA